MRSWSNLATNLLKNSLKLINVWKFGALDDHDGAEDQGADKAQGGERIEEGGRKDEEL